MSSFAVLLRLLLCQGKKPGASIDEMVKALGFKGKNFATGRILVINHLNSLNKVLKLIGLKIKYIPTLRTFTIVFGKSVEYTADLPKEVYKTLLILAKHFLKGEKSIDLDKIAKERNLSTNTIKKHVCILEEKGYVCLEGKKKIRKTLKLLVMLSDIR